MEKEEIQKKLEFEARNRNNGICETYEYCKYCVGNSKKIRDFNCIKDIYVNGNTPCADAYITMQKGECI